VDHYRELGHGACRVSKLTHQACTGLTVRYTNARVGLMHKHEVKLGDPRLYQWVMNFKPFLMWGKPTVFDISNCGISFRKAKGIA
jgi:hypothetical protein